MRMENWKMEISHSNHNTTLQEEEYIMDIDIYFHFLKRKCILFSNAVRYVRM